MAELCPVFSLSGVNTKDFIRKFPLVCLCQCYFRVVVYVTTWKLTFFQGSRSFTVFEGEKLYETT